MGLKEEEPQTVPGSSERPGRFLSLREDRSEALWVMDWFPGLMVVAGAKKTRSTSSSQVVPWTGRSAMGEREREAGDSLLYLGMGWGAHKRWGSRKKSLRLCLDPRSGQGAVSACGGSGLRRSG